MGADDKRQMTALLTICMTGQLLPPQLIYGGKTDACHPNYSFPENWHITHSENHWSNEATMLSYCDNILTAYLNETRKSPSQKALVILDVFAAHRCSSVKQKLESLNCVYIYVPAGCTGDLQPLDLAVNDEYKGLMKAQFTDYYADEVAAEIDNETVSESETYKLKLSVLKPLHAA